MRVLIAPGSFGPDLPAVEAAAAIAEGWARRAPGDELLLAPLSDGGTGYLAVLRQSLGGSLLTVSATSVTGARTPATILVVGDTAYLEAAQVAGVTADRFDVETASSLGVGLLVAQALALGLERVVVGVGASGVASNDGGAGLLAALGATSEPTGLLTGGSSRLGSVLGVDLAPALELVGSTRLVLVSDDDVPLLGLRGTTNAAGRSRGLAPERIPAVDAALEHYAGVVGRRTALAAGAGAGGGIGYGLMLAGAAKRSGLGAVMADLGLLAKADAADLVVTGELALDLSFGSGLVATSVAAAAGSVATPCIALAARLGMGARELRALGIESAYAVPDDGPAEDAPVTAELVAARAERVARTWSWSRSAPPAHPGRC